MLRKLQISLASIARLPELYLLSAIGLMALYLYLATPTVLKVREIQGTASTPVELPLQKKLAGAENVRIAFEIHSRFKQPYYLKIVPDGCVTAVISQGRALDVSNISTICDSIYGFALEYETLQPATPQSHLKVEIEVVNQGLTGGLDAYLLPDYDVFTLSLRLGFFMGLFLLLYLVLRRTKLPIPLALAVLVRLAFFSILITANTPTISKGIWIISKF